MQADVFGSEKLAQSPDEAISRALGKPQFAPVILFPQYFIAGQRISLSNSGLLPGPTQHRHPNDGSYSSQDVEYDIIPVEHTAR